MRIPTYEDHLVYILNLPLPQEVYNQLPLSLKLLAWHTDPSDLHKYQQWLDGSEEKLVVETAANSLWFQDYTGIPEINNMATQRAALADVGKDPSVIRCAIPTHMVIDHSVRTSGALQSNLEEEIRLNGDRYRLAKWSARELGIAVIPPNKGVIHQVNTEKYLNVFSADGKPTFGKGTDSHSPMVNALSILAWGVGGTEALEVAQGKAISMAIPKVYAVRLNGKLSEGVNASDLALYLMKVLRKVGVTGAFIQFIGEGVDTLPLESRATVANVAAEFGSRIALFGIDQETLDFLVLTGRDEGVEERAKAYGMWRSTATEDDVQYTQTIDVELSEVEAGISGPDKPHNWVPLSAVETHVRQVFSDKGVEESVFSIKIDGQTVEVPNGALLLASISSCTQTANPEAVLRAALLIRNARRAGLTVKPWVKTAFSAGSALADQYLGALGLTEDIEAFGFPITAHGCGACISQSGGLNAMGDDLIAMGLKPISIVSANRNYAGRQDAKIAISFLGRPDLVVCYAILGRMDVDLLTADFGNGVSFADISPSDREVADAKRIINAQMFSAVYDDLFTGDKAWESIKIPEGQVYDWPASVTVQKPPFFEGLSVEPAPIVNLEGARTLAIFGDGFSTDAISPAGETFEIPAAIAYLRSKGVTNPADVLSIGGYRANHEMLMATIFSNPTNQNKMVEQLGGWTIHHTSGEEVTIFEAACRYRESGISQVVIGGREYGCGSSRVMAASGPWMLGVRVVIAESFEAIHRANLWQMGVVPFTFESGTTAETLGLDGSEAWDIPLSQITQEGGTLNATFTRASGESVSIRLVIALESPQEFEFLVHGGSMQKQMRELAAAA